MINTNTTVELTPLKNRLMQVFLHLGCWTGEKIDHATSGEVDRVKKTKRATAKVTKRLIPTEALKPIRAFDKHIRAVHETMTMSVGTGRSVLPARAFMKYRDQIAKLFDERKAMVTEFIDETYPELREKAKEDMGEMYNGDEFPEPSALASRFTTDIEVNPMPENHKLLELCDIPDDDRKAIYDDAENRANDRMEKIRREAFTKLIEPIKHMAEILKRDGRMHESLFSNVSEILDVAECFNLEDSDEFSEMVATVRRKLTGYSVEDCRADKEIKEVVAKRAEEAMEEIMNTMAGVFPPASDSQESAA